MTSTTPVIRAGELRNKIVIEAQTETPDDIGGATIGWATAATVFAAARPVRVDAGVDGGKQHGRARFRFYMRDEYAVGSSHRITWGARTFEISGVRNLSERGVAMEIEAIELDV
jgi:head-tail adaptor